MVCVCVAKLTVFFCRCIFCASSFFSARYASAESGRVSLAPRGCCSTDAWHTDCLKQSLRALPERMERSSDGEMKNCNLDNSDVCDRHERQRQRDHTTKKTKRAGQNPPKLALHNSKGARSNSNAMRARVPSLCEYNIMCFWLGMAWHGMAGCVCTTRASRTQRLSIFTLLTNSHTATLRAMCCVQLTVHFFVVVVVVVVPALYTYLLMLCV